MLSFLMEGLVLLPIVLGLNGTPADVGGEIITFEPPPPIVKPAELVDIPTISTCSQVDPDLRRPNMPVMVRMDFQIYQWGLCFTDWDQAPFYGHDVTEIVNITVFSDDGAAVITYTASDVEEDYVMSGYCAYPEWGCD